MSWPSLLKMARPTSYKGLVRRSMRGMRFAAYGIWLLHFYNKISQSPYKAIINKNPLILCKFTGEYLADFITTKNRLNALSHHYSQMARFFRAPKFAQDLQNGITLWSTTKEEDTFSILLNLPNLTCLEGELCLDFHLNHTSICVLTFTIVPGSILGLQAEEVLFIGGSQGIAGASEKIRYAAKRNNEIWPLTMLVIALQAMGKAVDIPLLAGIAAQNHATTSVRTNTTKYLSTYDDFWEANGGIRHDTVHLFSTTLHEKPIEQIARNHRCRTKRKRAIKNELMNEILATFEQYAAV